MTAFLGTWPILPTGLDMTLRELVAEAAADIPALTRAIGVRLVGPLSWRLDEHYLRCEAPAVARQEALR